MLNRMYVHGPSKVVASDDLICLLWFIFGFFKRDFNIYNYFKSEKPSLYCTPGPLPVLHNILDFES